MLNPEIENESVDGEDDEEEYQESDYHDRPGPSSFRYSRDHSSEEEELQGETAELDEIQHLDYDDSCVSLLQFSLFYFLSLPLQCFHRVTILCRETWN